MPQLTDLPGTDGSPRDCALVRSVSGVRNALAKGIAVTVAGDNGAINIWKDDEGKYRCERMRFMVIQDSQVFVRAGDIGVWFKAAYAAIQ